MIRYVDIATPLASILRYATMRQLLPLFTMARVYSATLLRHAFLMALRH